MRPPIDMDAAFQAETVARLHAARCERCFVPIIDAEGNPGLYGEACKEGVKILAAYVRSIGETVPPWME